MPTRKAKFLRAVVAAMDVYKVPNVLLIYTMGDGSLHNSTLCADKAQGQETEKFFNKLSDQLDAYLITVTEDPDKKG